MVSPPPLPAAFAAGFSAGPGGKGRFPAIFCGGFSAGPGAASCKNSCFPGRPLAILCDLCKFFLCVLDKAFEFLADEDSI